MITTTIYLEYNIPRITTIYLEYLHSYYLSFQKFDNPSVNQIGYKNILLDMVVHTLNPCTPEAETEISLCVRGQTGLHSEYQNSQSYIKTLLNICPTIPIKEYSSEHILVLSHLLMQLFTLIFWGYIPRQREISLKLLIVPTSCELLMFPERSSVLAHSFRVKKTLLYVCPAIFVCLISISK